MGLGVTDGPSISSFSSSQNSPEIKHGAGYLPRPNSPPDPQWWMAEIRKGIEHRNKMTYKTKWDQWRKWYRGQFGANVLPVNVFFKMLRTMVPRVYFRNPQVSIVPRKHQQGQIDYWIMASLLEQVDNALFDRMRLKHAMKRAIQDAFLFGTGVLKLGYGGEFSPTPDLLAPEEAPVTRKGMTVEYNSFVLPDAPWVLRVPTGRFVVPQYSLDWPSCRWAAHIERRHVDDVREDKRFKNVKDIKPGVFIQPGEMDTLSRTHDMCDVWDVRDKKTGRVMGFAPASSDKVIFDDDDELQFNKRLPYFPIQFNTDDEFFWAVPDAMILEPHQKELLETRQIIRRHRRISVIKWLVKQGAISADDQTKMQSDSEVGAVINLDKDHNVSDVKDMTVGDIPAGLIKMDALENQQVQETLGMGVNQFGEYAPGSADRSATESMIVNQATQIRTDERRDAVADTIVDMTEHLNFILLKKWDADQIVSIAGEGGRQLWVVFKQQDIKSLEYDVKVDPDSSVPETKAVREQKAEKRYAMFGPPAGQAIHPEVDQSKLLRITLGEMGGPPLMDIIKEQVPNAPGAPGSSPANPMQMADVIKLVTGGGGVR